jgi:hypothetical protein
MNGNEARFERNSALETVLLQRFRPEMKPAVDAWLKLDPLNDRSAPPSPFRLAEYAQTETAEVARQAGLAALAVLLLLGTVVALTTMPVCRE